MKYTILLPILAGTVFGQTLPLIPKPKSIQPQDGTFAFSAATAIRFDKKLSVEAELLSSQFNRLTGQKAKAVAEELRINLPSEVSLDIDESLPLKVGGYQLNITPKAVKIIGKDAAGAFWGMQTLLQLLPAQFPMKQASAVIPAMTIADEPEFAWRGMHVDCGRHFFPIEDLKNFIDQMAFHKLNVFHWHLTEDQGWRIEIKKYPKLTEVGGFRESSPPYGKRNSDDGKRYGGFYTQEQIKDLVAYATKRHVTIVPEIELPGHAAAAIAAYPELGNTDVPGYAPKVMTRWGVHPYTFAPKEETFTFLENVLTEVCELFPSSYIHIGGDEAPKTQWNQSKLAKEVMTREGLKNADELQSYFIGRMEKFLASKKRNLIGWDEIQEGGLPKTATMMVWRDVNWAHHALDKGNTVVMAPNAYAYLDHYQHPAEVELAKGAEYEAIGGFLTVQKLYNYDPASIGRNEDERKRILGVQAQLWTEYMKDWKKVEYMAFPRIAALAEIAWLPTAQKDYPDFRVRLDGVMKHYDAVGINRATPEDPPKKETKDGSKIETSLNIHDNHAVEFAFDGKTETFFWAARELKKDDHVTLQLASPVAKEATVTVNTGGKASANGDRLEQGVLQASEDGKQWKNIAEFAEGKASGKIPAGTKAIRILVNAPQKNWLIIHEIVIES